MLQQNLRGAIASSDESWETAHTRSTWEVDSFRTGHANWGLLARRGHFEIEIADLCRIAPAMGADPRVCVEGGVPLRSAHATFQRQGVPGIPAGRARDQIGRASCRERVY